MTSPHALERQIMVLAARNAELLMALEEIARKKKMDAVAAVSMRAGALEAKARGREMTQQTIWYQVADLTEPTAEPYMVLRIDTSIRCGATGVEGEVVSLHWDRAEAEAHAASLSRC